MYMYIYMYIYLRGEGARVIRRRISRRAEKSGVGQIHMAAVVRAK